MLSQLIYVRRKFSCTEQETQIVQYLEGEYNKKS